MAYSNTPTSRVGDMIDSAFLNTYGRDNFNATGANSHTGADGDGSSTLDSLDHIDFDQTGSGLSEPAAGHVRLAANNDGTMRFRAQGGSELTIAIEGHTH